MNPSPSNAGAPRQRRLCSLLPQELLAAALLLAFLAAAFATDAARAESDNATDLSDEASVGFIKEFPGSEPPYYSITIKAAGEAVYRTAPDDPKPVAFHLAPATAQQFFRLAEKLNRFNGAELESKRKVAKMGTKTFVYQDRAEVHKVSFNHTEVPEALQLMGMFEKLSSTQQHRDRLEYLLRFDKLGIVKELLAVEIDLDGGRLLEPSLLLPILDRIQNNRSLVNVAQQRAATIIAKIQQAAP